MNFSISSIFKHVSFSILWFDWRKWTKLIIVVVVEVVIIGPDSAVVTGENVPDWNGGVDDSKHVDEGTDPSSSNWSHEPGSEVSNTEQHFPEGPHGIDHHPAVKYCSERKHENPTEDPAIT